MDPGDLYGDGLGTEGDEELEHCSESNPRDLYGDGSGTDSDEELKRGSELDPGDFEGDSLGIRKSLSVGEVIEENTQLSDSVAGMQSETQEAIEGDLTTPMGVEVNQGRFITMKQYFIHDQQFFML